MFKARDTALNTSRREAPGWLGRLSVQLLISAWVLISQFVGSSPLWGSPRWHRGACLGFSLSLSAPPLLVLSLSLSQNKQTLKRSGRAIHRLPGGGVCMEAAREGIPQKHPTWPGGHVGATVDEPKGNELRGFEKKQRYWNAGQGDPTHT